MKRQRIWMLGMAVVFGAITLSGPTSAQSAAGQVILPKNAAQAYVAAQRREEPHPEIRLALRSLEEAQRRLENSAHDFHGHRAKALALTTRAIDELHKALRYDRR